MNVHGCTKCLDELGHQGRAESFKVTNKVQADPISISSKVTNIYEVSEPSGVFLSCSYQHFKEITIVRGINQ
jgi:hypothetical protein